MRVMESSAALQALPPVSPAFVRPSGVEEATAALGRAERLLEQSRYAETIASLSSVQVPTVSAPALAVRVLHCEAWARMYLGQLDSAAALCERARALTEGPAFTDGNRAEALFRLGACRLKAGGTTNAVFLFGEAIRLGGDRVRAAASSSATGTPRRQTPSGRSSSPRTRRTRVSPHSRRCSAR